MNYADKLKAATPQRLAFQKADDAWSAALQAEFGRRAGDARYRPEGRGAEGSNLRACYEAREAARVAHDIAMGVQPHMTLKIVTTPS